MSNPIKLAVLGLGTVGTGVVHLLRDNLAELKRRSGQDIVLSHVGERKHRDDIDANIVQSDDLFAICENPDIDIVIEVIGGTTIAKDVITHALKHRKHVVTANKALLAHYGNELFALAEENNVHIAYEASVAGGIPIIKVMRESLSANKVEWVAGIINGTGNFILSEMREKGRSFADVLAEAQQLGYAEADPTFDVEGIDAGHKLALLASTAFGIPLDFDKVYCEGITKITTQDVEYAEQLGYRIKHLGMAVRRTQEDGSDAIELRVHPTLIPEDKLLANVNGVQNAVLVNSHPLGQSLYYGAGAGAGATASAIVADVMDLVRVIGVDGEGHHVAHLGFKPSEIQQKKLLTTEEIISSYYLRVHILDNVGVLADITRILSDLGISIEAILQQPAHKAGQVPVIILTQAVVEQKMNQAIAQIEALDDIIDNVVRIRLEELD